jgi:hypothetical protein
MKTFEIEIPDGFEIDRKASTFEKIVFKPKIILPNTWEELGEQLSGELTQAFIALAKLAHLRDIYRGDWKPDWRDDSQEKYCIEFEGSLILMTTYHVTACEFLSFPSYKIRDEFLDNFEDLIREAQPLMS